MWLRCFLTQAAWVCFAETGAERILCILQPSVLTTCTLSGELHTIPFTDNFTQLWPLCRGVLLTVNAARTSTQYANPAMLAFINVAVTHVSPGSPANYLRLRNMFGRACVKASAERHCLTCHRHPIANRQTSLLLDTGSMGHVAKENCMACRGHIRQVFHC